MEGLGLGSPLHPAPEEGPGHGVGQEAPKRGWKLSPEQEQEWGSWHRALRALRPEGQSLLPCFPSSSNEARGRQGWEWAMGRGLQGL